jgi:hypothetical protein
LVLIYFLLFCKNSLVNGALDCVAGTDAGDGGPSASDAVVMGDRLRNPDALSWRLLASADPRC